MPTIEGLSSSRINLRNLSVNGSRRRTISIYVSSKRYHNTDIWSLPFFEKCTPKCTLFLPYIKTKFLYFISAVIYSILMMYSMPVIWLILTNSKVQLLYTFIISFNIGYSLRLAKKEINSVCEVKLISNQVKTLKLLNFWMSKYWKVGTNIL